MPAVAFSGSLVCPNSPKVFKNLNIMRHIYCLPALSGLSSLLLWSVWAVAAAIGFSSCDEDAFSQVVEIELPSHTPKPVLVCVLNAGDTMVSALVSRSKGILDRGNFEYPANAQVQLWGNGAVLATLVFNPLSLKYEARLAQPLPADGGAYRLELVLPGFAPAWAEQAMPRPPVIVSAALRRSGVITNDGARQDEIIIEIQDPAQEQNYYRIFVKERLAAEIEPGDTTVLENERYLNFSDPNFSYGSGANLIITDGAFNGRNYKLRFSTYPQEVIPEIDASYVVWVYQISREAYLYERTRSVYEQNTGNPFAEPIQVFSNIQEGYGIFALGNAVRVLVR